MLCQGCDQALLPVRRDHLKWVKSGHLNTHVVNRAKTERIPYHHLGTERTKLSVQRASLLESRPTYVRFLKENYAD